jgi:hypothetical protein
MRSVLVHRVWVEHGEHRVDAGLEELLDVDVAVDVRGLDVVEDCAEEERPLEHLPVAVTRQVARHCIAGRDDRAAGKNYSEHEAGEDLQRPDLGERGPGRLDRRRLQHVKQGLRQRRPGCDRLLLLLAAAAAAAEGCEEGVGGRRWWWRSPEAREPSGLLLLLLLRTARFGRLRCLKRRLGAAEQADEDEDARGARHFRESIQVL